jgi:hypothetical protein
VNRLARLLVNIGIVASVLLCAAATLLWMRGHFRMDRVWVQVHPEHRPDLKYGLLTLQSGNGGVGFGYNRVDFSNHPDPGRNAKAVYAGSVYGASDPQYPNEWDGVAKYAFHWENTHASPPGALPCFVGGVTCTVPCWAIIGVTLPARRSPSNA